MARRAYSLPSRYRPRIKHDMERRLLATPALPRARRSRGVLLSAAIVQYLPAPRVLPYVLLLVLFLVALAATWRLREPVEVAPGARFRLTPPGPTCRRSPAGGSCWPRSRCSPRGRSAASSSRSGHSSRRSSSAPTATWSTGPASSSGRHRLGRPARLRPLGALGRRHLARWRWPRAWR